MAPHPLLMASLRWMCFSTGESTCPACKSLRYLDANAAEERKSKHKPGAVCVLAAEHGQGGVVARGWCREAPATFPGTTILFPGAEGGSSAFYGSSMCLQSFGK